MAKTFILTGNLVLALGLVILLGLQRITWEQFVAGLALLAYPGTSVLTNREQSPQRPPAARPPFLMTLLLTTAFAAVAGCSREPASPAAHAARAANAVELAMYAQALDECRARGRVAGSYAVYETCANDADRRFGRAGAASKGESR